MLLLLRGFHPYRVLSFNFLSCKRIMPRRQTTKRTRVQSYESISIPSSNAHIQDEVIKAKTSRHRYQAVHNGPSNNHTSSPAEEIAPTIEPAAPRLRRSRRDRKPVDYRTESDNETEDDDPLLSRIETKAYPNEGSEASVTTESDSSAYELDGPETLLSKDVIKRKRSTSSTRKVSKKNLLEDSELSEEPQASRPIFDCPDKPLPWKGRLGYACQNTVLRFSREIAFCSRTCRIATIQKESLQFAKDLGIKNTQDLATLVEWNHRFGIHFMRVSSDLFPFASHGTYGYSLEFADSYLQAVGELANRYNHRLSTHPGQYTQIASPKESVVTNAIRDLRYHEELLSRMKLNEQLNRDAVIILHLGGSFEGKEETLNRFRDNYVRLPEAVKMRLVLENDDVTWSVQDLLPLCQELSIPLVLDWHHHNVVPGTLREGSLDLMPLLPAIRETWTRKGITQKQHYSESAYPFAISAMKRRGHSDRVYSLPPCEPDMDLMIEAKEKEQAIFELSRIFNLTNPSCPKEIEGPDFDVFNEGYYPPGAHRRLIARKQRKKKSKNNKEEVKDDEETNTKDELVT
ncbi:endonuclease Uve1 [Schizosaccharomyces cryophilus OY26]|uniref:Endonuclease Uve1 n=1 Tax=Schizosaccharomyces cryophilus (strain OY26 / ATCC MYA-4695 / CBS 11777 / NBRC 106824 / NRRL Y48691) TaxID=653667 RepID=S9W811_SCHCR|nr:endonuclease Uve1 [Schizosaccharomyces cryophilus OY26]EPY53830.1 endonuclease Uve1 [Schizosaccharomyces cryophilus OY26]